MRGDGVGVSRCCASCAAASSRPLAPTMVWFMVRSSSGLCGVPPASARARHGRSLAGDYGYDPRARAAEAQCGAPKRRFRCKRVHGGLRGKRCRSVDRPDGSLLLNQSLFRVLLAQIGKVSLGAVNRMVALRIKRALAMSMTGSRCSGVNSDVPVRWTVPCPAQTSPASAVIVLGTSSDTVGGWFGIGEGITRRFIVVLPPADVRIWLSRRCVGWNWPTVNSRPVGRSNRAVISPSGVVVCVEKVMSASIFGQPSHSRPAIMAGSLVT